MLYSVLYSDFSIDDTIYIKNILYLISYNNFDSCKFNHSCNTKSKTKSNSRSVLCKSSFD